MFKHGFLKVLICIFIFTAILGIWTGSVQATFQTEPMVSSKGEHTLILKSDGTVWATGNNFYGALGDGSTESTLTPLQVEYLTKITKVAAGEYHSLALSSSGSVWVWGDNRFGALGLTDDPYYQNGDHPAPVQNNLFPTNAVDLAAGKYHSLVVDRNGDVWASGSNATGQLGIGTEGSYHYTPVQLQSTTMSNVVAIAAGANHSLALTADGAVWAWGDNFYGQLGDNSKTRRVSPKEIISTGVMAIAAGEYHSVALKTDGTVWVWGCDDEDQLANGTDNDLIPQQVFSNAIAISAGKNHTMALKADGSVWGWGNNDYYELGSRLGNFDAYRPLENDYFSNVIAIGAGYNRSFAIQFDGTVLGIGLNNGALGDNSPTDQTVAVEMQNLNVKSSIPMLAAGYSYSLALKSDGTIWGWGANNDGQLGDGVKVAVRYQPVTVETSQGEQFTDAIAISAHSFHSLALKRDGTVWAFGNNDYGQLGDGTKLTRSLPVQVQNLNKIIAISTGSYFSAALKNDGTVWTWGSNMAGALGDGSGLDQTTPVKVQNIPKMIAIATGDFHVLALDENGSLWSWGYNGNGQLGTGDTTYRTTPYQIQALENIKIKSIAAGGYHSLALTQDYKVMAWGNNTYGQLGDGTNTQRNLPFELPITHVTSIASGGYSSYLLYLGNLKSWGKNTNGQLGDGSNEDRYTPTEFIASDLTAFAAGPAHALALKKDGTIISWGANTSEALGADVVGDQNLPIRTRKLNLRKTYPKVSSFFDHTLVLRYDGTVWAWGENSSGQLGDLTKIDGQLPRQVQGLTEIIDVATGRYHSLALKADGTVWAWGNNSSGQFGITTISESLTPIQVPGLTNVRAIVSGSTHSLALKYDGTVWAWGDNSSGQIGDGGFSTTPVPPTQVFSSAQAISAGLKHSIALTDDGNLYAWGNNDQGQLGNGSPDPSYSPTLVTNTNMGKVKAISAGLYHNLAIGTDQTLWAWGYNYFGQIGNGTEGSANNCLEPVQITTLTNVREVNAGGYHSTAITTGGAVYGWGYNMQGCIGDGSTEKRLIPTPAKHITSGMEEITAGYMHTVALKEDGILWAFGDGYDGQIGDGLKLDRWEPVTVRQVNLHYVPVQISSFLHHNLAVSYTGAPLSWGDNQYYQLANGSTYSKDYPYFIFYLSDAVAVDAGARHSLILKANGTVWTFGDNTQDQLGYTHPTQPGYVARVNNLSDVIGIAAGAEHSLAVTTYGTVLAFGDNSYYQLGDMYNYNGSVPTEVPNLANVVAVAAGDHHSLALKSDGSLWTWGDNSHGQLGIGSDTIDYEDDPTQVLSDVITIAANGHNSMALKKDGTVWTWGSNDDKQLGYPWAGVKNNQPKQITSLSNIVAIAAGQSHMLALSADKKLYVWGNNEKGQCATDPIADPTISTPRLVSELLNVEGIAGGADHSLAYTSDGTIWAWGANYEWQLGVPGLPLEGTFTPSPSSTSLF